MKTIELADKLGKRALDRPRAYRDLFIMIYLSLRSTFSLRWQSFKPILYVLTSQIYFTGHMALPLITFIALATGSIVVMQSQAQLSLLGSQDMMGKILVVTIIREIGPLLTALVVIARSGTAVASELANMQVNKEIESLRSMSIDPLSYVVFPRLLGGIISLVCLAFYFNVIALVGGYFVATIVKPLQFSFYIEVIASALHEHDLLLNLLKNGISGLIIFSIACDQGFKVKNSPHEVPIATTEAVVKSIMTVMFFNLTLTAITFYQGLT